MGLCNPHTILFLCLYVSVDKYEKYSDQILDVLENKIFELDTMHRFGLVEFKLIFQDRESLSMKKTKKLIDLRE